MISYGKQYIDDDDIAAVVAALKSDFLTQGTKVTEFEQSLCKYTGAKYCVCLANGTAALHLSIATLEIEKGMDGITTPITFMASANAFVYNGLMPKFSDIDSRTYLIDINRIEDSLTEKTKVIIPVHFAGQPVDMELLHSILKNRNVFIVEDAAHAIGSKYVDGSCVGNCKYSDMTIFSFHPVKTITTGEGGAITTNSIDLYEKLLILRSHGITKSEEKLTQNPGPWYHEMQILGYNYRLTDIQAALGISQLRKLDEFVNRRREIVFKYNIAFKDVYWLTIPYEKQEVFSGFHLYVLQIDFEKIGKSRKQVMKQLSEIGIGTQVHYIPVHLQPYYKTHYGYKIGDFPVAEEYYSRALSLPLFPSLTDNQQDFIIEKVLELA
jgi:UDP-4-amino-4,6-dideoxy-N-acetyl-beta-L-altrosamine transaminase